MGLQLASPIKALPLQYRVFVNSALVAVRSESCFLGSSYNTVPSSF